MPKYAEDCWAQYLEHRSALRLVRCVYGRAVIEADKRAGQRLVPRATEALVKLAQSEQQQKFIELSAIANSAGFDTTAGTKGLYPWIKKYGADVLEQKHHRGAFRIRPEYYDAMQALFKDDS